MGVEVGWKEGFYIYGVLCEHWMQYELHQQPRKWKCRHPKMEMQTSDFYAKEGIDLNIVTAKSSLTMTTWTCSTQLHLAAMFHREASLATDTRVAHPLPCNS